MHLSRTGFLNRLRLIAVALGVAIIAVAQPAEAGRYASIVIDAENGSVLHAANPDTRSYPASLTKVMTLFLLFDELDSGRIRLDSKFTTSAHAAAQSPSKLGLEPGEKISVESLILALVTKSANDAAVVAAEGVGGTETRFAHMMTQKAHALGMRNTVYRNASGLPDTGQVSTVRDQATLARALIRSHPGYYKYFSTRQFVYDGQPINTHNRLMLRYQGADGIKTGYIHASGFNLISSAKRGDKRIIGVVFGGSTASSRDNHMGQLLDKGFAKLRRGGGVEMAAAETETEGNDDLPDLDDLEAAAQAAKAPAKAPAKAVAKAKPAPAKKVVLRAPARAADDDDDDDDAVGDADPSGWAIQVGAFSEYRPAHKAASDAAKKLGGLVSKASIDIDKAGKGAKALYRARISGFTEDQARAACKRLGKAGKSCKTVNPNA
ncbi:D-alanyl-D-alanine carboxypeptidase [Paramagnetospirillum magneticum]|uniref:D-alanyl-D-alanine carboxypeptidase n=1 Tax=Paramagnetospirillum magneticum (strain ATCC 700264 / AMB-1) TaxID=342108 RepID=Q2W8A3_PARM1|nr:D-alanyl-D-alanine carboxypeptidase [Paramagnetospirillum magneticum]BAE49922.1 D-alanyl-D-alanine carboxypeptidase [Paramagnetospirillum magneticum AMB-1]